MMSPATAFALALFTGTSAVAGVVNGDFSVANLGAADTITQDQADTGWYARSDTWGIATGEAQRNSSSNQRNNNQRGIAQIFTSADLLGPKGVFAFDYEVADPPLGGSLPLFFWLIGYSGSGDMDTDEDIDTFLISTNMPMSGAHYEVDILLQDDLTFSDGSFAGSYHASDIDFGGGYDYFGIAFSTGKNQDGWSVKLDNVVVAAPSPATLALLLAGVAGILSQRRKHGAQ
jgi:hypothetical protein